MDENELTKTVDGFIAAYEAPDGSPEYETNCWATGRVTEWGFEGQADLLWRFVLNAGQRDLKDEIAAVIAAGPLEDLISKYGAQYINQIEALARRDKKFNYLLGGVWKNTTPEDIWERIEAVRADVW